MEILTATFFPGPNRHVLRSAVEAVVDLKEYSGMSTQARPAFIARLLEALPGLEDHYCSRGYRGGFRERLLEGTYLGHVVEHVTIECLYQGGEQGSYGKTREIGPGRVLVVFESETREGGRLALEQAIRWVTRLWDGRPVDVAAELRQFREALAEFRLGPSTAAIVEAARRRDIPVARLDDRNFVRLGQGVHQRRIMASMADTTSVVGVDAAQDKRLTLKLLEDAGLPVPEGRLVQSAEQLAAVFQEMSPPLVLKPVHGHQGRGVAMHLTTLDALRAAFRAASAVAPGPFVVEREIPGTPYRLLVVGDRMVAASERRVPQVTGDGKQTIKELVAALNQDPRRGPHHGFPLSWVILDEEARATLLDQGWTEDSVPPSGAVVFLRRSANLSTGATARDVTDAVSPLLAREAVRAARAVGLDIAGVDIVAPRLDQPLTATGGAILEVNAAPGLRMHLYPDQGAPRPVGDAIVDYLFGHRPSRIPVAAITGTNGKTTVTRMIAHIAERAGYRVGMCTTDGIAIGGEFIKSGDLTGPWSSRLVLNDPTVEMAVLETARGGMARGGLGFDDVDVAVVTNIGRDHLGQDGIETLEDLIHLKSLIVDVVRPQGTAVLNADDVHVLTMRERCRGRLLLFSTRADNPEVIRHLARGGEAVFVKRGYLYYGSGEAETRLVGVRALPASLGGVAAMNVANAAAAAGAAIALGIAPRLVSSGLKTFPVGGIGLNRGRLELLYGPDLRVLVDYGHNVPAITALGDVCRRLKPLSILTVLGLPGDRRDDDIRASAQVVATFSQRVIIREDRDRRGRAVGEVAGLIEAALREAGLQNLEVILDEGQAVEQAILTAPPGSLVLVLYEAYHTVRAAAESALSARREALRTPAAALAEDA
ncbi:MAG: cyanophycin synthetase [Firmicutes bacterium]|nr:cyanophycin synthetase [Bacillota bacterium]